MGFSSPIDDHISNLSRARNMFLTSIEINDVQLKTLEKDISEKSQEITDLKNEIKQFQYSLTKEELQLKAQKLISLENDSKSLESKFNNKNNYNETLKQNLSTIENKIDELKMYKNVKEGNKILKELGLIDTCQALEDNAFLILKEQEKQEQINQKLQITSELLNEDKRTPDDVLKEILGVSKTEENGGFY